LAPCTELLTVGEAHQVAVPRGLKVQAPEPDFKPGGEGVRISNRGTRCESPWWELMVDCP
jgi:hypothetical protein